MVHRPTAVKVVTFADLAQTFVIAAGTVLNAQGLDNGLAEQIRQEVGGGGHKTHDVSTRLASGTDSMAIHIEDAQNGKEMDADHAIASIDHLKENTLKVLSDKLASADPKLKKLLHDTFAAHAATLKEQLQAGTAISATPAQIRAGISRFLDARPA